MRAFGIWLIFNTIFALTVPAVTQTRGHASAQLNEQASVQASQGHAQLAGGASTSSSASAQSNPANAGLGSGTTFNATLIGSVDSGKAKPGDAISARTAETVIAADGKAVIPKGTKLIGHITPASARANRDSKSTLVLTFDRAILSNGAEVPLHVAVQALAAAQTAATMFDANIDATGNGDVSAMGGRSGFAGSDVATGSHGFMGVTSIAGTSAGTLTNTVPTATVGGRGSLEHSTGVLFGTSRGASGGLNTAGRLTSNSHGVFGLNGLNLKSADGTQGSVITSAGRNVHLESGARLLMVTQTAAFATPAR